MLVRYKGRGTKEYKHKNTTFHFVSGEWVPVEDLEVFRMLKRYPDVFDTVQFFDLKPFMSIRKKVKFKKNIVISCSDDATRKLKKMRFLLFQAKKPETGESVFKITNYNNSNLDEYKDVKDVNVLIYRTLGGLGDIIMTLPIVEQIHKEYLNYETSYACPQKFLSLVKSNPNVESLLAIENQSTTQKDWDVTVDLSSDCIKYEFEHQPDVDLNRPEIFANKCGLELERIPRPKLYLSKTEIKKAKEELKGTCLKIGLVLKSYALIRNWSYFQELKNRLLGEFPDCTILEIQGGEPKNYEQKERCYPVFGRSLRELMGLMNECDLVISPDTGPAHIASALRVPTIWIFTHIDGKVRTKNYDNVSVCQSMEGCPIGKPCWYDISCSKGNQNIDTAPCNSSVSVESVLKRAQSALNVPNLSYVVVCSNRREITETCVNKILKHRKWNEEVIVVDNGSSDGTGDWLEDRVRENHKFYLIRNKVNEGCVKARNQAFKIAKGRFILTLDNDQYISNHTVHNLMSVEADIAGTEAWSMDADAMAYPLKENRGPLAYVGAGGMLIKRLLLRALGGFDEAYSPAWFEDPDFCFSAVEKGFSLGFHPDPGIEHLKHKTVFTQEDFDHQKIWARNHKIFQKKWEKRLKASPIFSVVILHLNRAYVAKKCIESVYKGARHPVEVILLDQGSRSEDIETLESLKFSNYKFIKGNENRFVAAGRNFASKEARGKYTLFCDDDMTLPSGWDTRLLKRLESSGCVALSPSIIDRRNGDIWLRYQGTEIVNGRFVDKGKEAPLYSGEALEEKLVDILPGGALVVLTSFFKENPFDENYVYGLEDYDWCLSTKKKGFELCNCPSVVFVHDKDGSKREIPIHNAKKKQMDGSSYIEDSARLFLHRWEKTIPNLWNEPEYINLAWGSLEFKSREEKRDWLSNQVKIRFPEEIENG